MSINENEPMDLTKFYTHLMQWVSCHGLSIDDVSVSHGGSMLLLGLIETTDDIDLTVSSEIFNGFDNGHHEVKLLGDNRYLIKVGKRVDIHTSELHPAQLQSCLVKHPNGIWYRNAQQTLIDYLALGRDKDQAKIQSLFKLCAHSSKDLTYRFGEGFDINNITIPETIEDPEIRIIPGEITGRAELHSLHLPHSGITVDLAISKNPEHHKKILEEIAKNQPSNLPIDAQGNKADLLIPEEPVNSWRNCYLDEAKLAKPQIIHVKDNQMFSIEGEAVELKDGYYEVQLKAYSPLDLGPQSGIFRRKFRRITVDFGVIVSDTSNKDVGMKIDLESGDYIWDDSGMKTGSWVRPIE